MRNLALFVSLLALASISQGCTAQMVCGVAVIVPTEEMEVATVVSAPLIVPWMKEIPLGDKAKWSYKWHAVVKADRKPLKYIGQLVLVGEILYEWKTYEYKAVVRPNTCRHIVGTSWWRNFIQLRRRGQPSVRINWLPHRDSDS